MIEAQTVELTVVVGTGASVLPAVMRALDERGPILILPQSDAIGTWRDKKRSAARSGEVAVRGVGLEIREDLFLVSYQGSKLDLTPREFAVLRCLASAPGRVWRFADLCVYAWGQRYMGDTAPIRSALKRLRRKLDATELRIESVYGVGYRLMEDRE